MRNHSKGAAPNHDDRLLAQRLESMVVMKYAPSETALQRKQQADLLGALGQANNALNARWKTHEFGASLRFIQEMQGGVKTPYGGLLQFYADKDSNHAIVDIVEVAGGVERMRTDGLLSCCALEAHIQGFSVLLHGFGSDNLRSLFAYSMLQVKNHGGDPRRLEPITLYAESHWDYQQSMEQVVTDLGISVAVEFGPLMSSGHLAYPTTVTVDVF